MAPSQWVAPRPANDAPALKRLAARLVTLILLQWADQRTAYR
jgi:hypothetical protein